MQISGLLRVVCGELEETNIQLLEKKILERLHGQIISEHKKITCWLNIYLLFIFYT